MDTPLTMQVRALYEDTVVPVREIARLAGVTERTLYKYVQRGGWRRRHRCLARDQAVAAANFGRRLAPSAAFAPAKGAGSPFVARSAGSPFVARSAGGRFTAREAAGVPHASGLGALDPVAQAAAAKACSEVGVLGEAAMAAAIAVAQARAVQERAEREARAARALAEKAAQADVRSYEILSDALIELVKLRGTRKAGAIPAADRLDAALEDAILAQMERLVAQA